jgi:tetratricopeptide (TPR) repeat protein
VSRASALLTAIEHFQSALRVYTETEFPYEWAMTQHNLGTAYFELPTGDRSENLRKAIACLEAAVRGFKAVGLHERAAQVRQIARRLEGYDTTT